MPCLGSGNSPFFAFITIFFYGLPIFSSGSLFELLTQILFSVDVQLNFAASVVAVQPAALPAAQPDAQPREIPVELSLRSLLPPSSLCWELKLGKQQSLYVPLQRY